MTNSSREQLKMRHQIRLNSRMSGRLSLSSQTAGPGSPAVVAGTVLAGTVLAGTVLAGTVVAGTVVADTAAAWPAAPVRLARAPGEP
jgi:hypothetical protein